MTFQVTIIFGLDFVIQIVFFILLMTIHLEKKINRYTIYFPQMHFTSAKSKLQVCNFNRIGDFQPVRSFCPIFTNQAILKKNQNISYRLGQEQY